MVEDYALPQCLWYRLFIEVQGYAVEEIKFHQDNMGAILIKRMVNSQSQIEQSTSE